MSFRSPLFVAALTLPCLASATFGQEPGVVRTTDASGTEIVTLTGAPGDYGSIGSLAAAPDLEIASLTGSDVDFLGAIRAVRTLPDGSLIVADGQKGLIGLFDPEGDPVGTMGGLGEVPGLFRTLSTVPFVSGDSVWVWDEMSDRMTVFSTDGSVARSMMLPPPASFEFQKVFVLPNGGLLGSSEGRVVFPTMGIQMGSTLQRDSVHLVLYSPTGAMMRPLVSFPGAESLQVLLSTRPNQVTSITLPLPFQRNGPFAVTDEWIVGGANDRFELSWWSHEGDLERVTRFPSYDRPVSAAEVDALRGEWLEQAGGSPQSVEMVEMSFSEAAIPELLPAFQTVLVGQDGRVWVREHDLHADGAPKWWAFDPDGGVPEGWLEVPANLEVHEIGEDYVLAVWRDFTGLPFVRRYLVDLSE